MEVKQILTKRKILTFILDHMHEILQTFITFSAKTITSILSKKCEEQYSKTGINLVP